MRCEKVPLFKTDGCQLSLKQTTIIKENIIIVKKKKITLENVPGVTPVAVIKDAIRTR